MAVIGLGVTEGSQTDPVKSFVVRRFSFLCRALSFDGDRTKSIPTEKAFAEVDYPSHSLHWRILAIPCPPMRVGKYNAVTQKVTGDTW